MTAFPNIDAIERFEKAVRANGYRTCDAATDTEYQAAKAAILAEARKAEAMEREVAELRKALKPFAEEAEKWNSLHCDSLVPNLTPSVVEACDRELAAFTVGDLRRARTLLNGGSDAQG